MLSGKNIWLFIKSPVNTMKSFWQKKTASEKWHSFHGFVWFFGRALRHEVFTMRPNGFIPYSGCVICIMTCMLMCYTTCYYIYIGEIVKIIPVYCMLGIMASSYSVNWSMVLRDRLKWRPLLSMPGEYLYRKDVRSTSVNDISSKSVDQLIRSYIITLTVIILSFVGALIGPFNAYIKDGSVVTLYELRIPFLQEHPKCEFIVNMTWQSYINLCGVPSLFIIEGMTSIVMNAITVSSMLTVNELENFSGELEIDKTAKNQYVFKLVKIFNQIIYMDDYIENFREMWYWRLFLSAPTFLFSISVYSQLKLGFPAGYGIAVVSYVQMAILCVSGQNVVDRNDRLLEGFYDFKWNQLPPKYQKDVIFMIHHLQNREGLTIGPFEQLNFETLKVLTQKVYSFLMFMINFGA